MKGFIFYILLLLFSLNLFSETFYIAYINDIHGHLYYKKRCQISKLAWMLKTLRRHYQPIFLFDAGDIISGSIYANFSKGEDFLRVYSKLSPSFTTLGNHEFDYAPNHLINLYKKHKIPVVCSNIISKNEFPMMKYSILKIGKYKIGIFGLITPDTVFLSNPKTVANYKFMDIFKTTRDILAIFKKKGVNFIIALTHIGYKQDYALALEFPKIDLIIGGHSHTLLSNPIRINNTAIVQAESYGRYLGFLKINIDDDKKLISGGLIALNNKIPDDPEFLSMAKDIKNKIELTYKEPICELKYSLSSSAVRRHETRIANMICDALRKKTNVDIVILNAGSIRAPLKKGTLTYKDIFSTFPFDNEAVILRVNKKQLIDILNHGFTALIDSSKTGRFPIISGFKVKAYINVNKEIHLDIDIPQKETYLLLTSSYLLGGGDGYTMLKNYNMEYTPFSGYNIRELLVEQLKKEKILTPKIDGRIYVSAPSF